jgi:RNase P/RNase MRP subunit POP5/HAMP domain-containing protein
MHKIICLLLALAAIRTAPAIDLSDLKKSFSLGVPTATINIEHPPSIRLNLAAIAIGNLEGQCSDGVASRVEENFVEAGITVVDRQRYADILSEHKLQITDASLDRRTAARISALSGAQALLTIKVLDCNTSEISEKLYTNKKGITTYLYTVQAMISGSLRIVDLNTGKLRAVQRFEGQGKIQANEGYPDSVLAMTEAENDAAFAVRKLLLPWKETKRFVFYDDSECNLRLASTLLKAQDIDKALLQSESNLADCKALPNAKPGLIARAYYNMGVLQCMKSDFDGALANLTEAQKLNDSRVFTNVVADCGREKELAAALTTYDDDTTTPRLKFAWDGRPTKKSSSKDGSNANAARPSIEDRLSRLDELLKKKLITQEEYQQHRAKLLEEI